MIPAGTSGPLRACCSSTTKVDRRRVAARSHEESVTVELHPAADGGAGPGHRDFTESIRLDPKDARSFRFRGDSWQYKDEHAKAIADFDQAIRLDPQSASAFEGCGLSHQQLRDHDRAIADYTEAIRLDPKDPGGLLRRGRLWKYKARAIGRSWTSRRRSASIPLTLKRSKLAASSGRTRASTRRRSPIFDQAIRIDPMDAWTYLSRGYSQSKSGEHVKAGRRLHGGDPPQSKSAVAYYNRGPVEAGTRR